MKNVFEKLTFAMWVFSPILLLIFLSTAYFFIPEDASASKIEDVQIKDGKRKAFIVKTLVYPAAVSQENP